VAPGALGSSLLASLAALLALAALARPAFGLGALVVAALVVGALSFGVSEVARAAEAAGHDPFPAVLVAWPLHKALQLSGGLCLASALAEPVPLDIPVPGRRVLVRAGLVLVALGLAAEPWLRPAGGDGMASAARV
jgi:hypothetical protein